MSTIPPPAAVNPVVDYYTHVIDERERLRHDIGPLEQARTRELIQRYLPPPPVTVFDVGGASGPYAFWLAELGYAAHLIDVVPRHIEQARALAAQPGAPQLASAAVGDARALDLPDACADAVLMHGPLYHLAERADRLLAIGEARRVLRPGGVLLAFGITRYAGLIYGLTAGHVFDRDYMRMIAHEVRTGHRQNAPAWMATFPNAYFHLPDELVAEVREGGLRCEGALGVIGPAWLAPDLAASWADEAQRETFLEAARLTEHEPALGARILAVGGKE